MHIAFLSMVKVFGGEETYEISYRPTGPVCPKVNNKLIINSISETIDDECVASLHIC